MKSIQYITVILIGLAACFAVSCEQNNTPVSGVEQSDETISAQKLKSNDWREDPGLYMRQQLRSMNNDEFKRSIEKGGLTVMIGFKEEGTVRGVSKKGKSLVEKSRAEHFANQVVPQFADSVIYRFKHIPAIAVKLKNAEMALQLRNLPWIDYVVAGSGLVTPDAVSMQCSPISSPQSVPWNITQVGADIAWTEATGSNAPGKLVVLDDGADENNGWHGTELDWEAYTYYVPSTSSDGNHGTLVLGAAQANDNNYGTVGVAPDAMARVMKIYDPTTGDPQNEEWEVHAATAIDDNAILADVMTISYSTKITSSTPPIEFTGLYDAISNAYNQHDVVFTASTGNQGSSSLYAFPANYDEVIGVGGSDKNDNYTLNNYAPGNVEIAAPAVDILTVCKGGDIGAFDGTSFATPMVAGAVMLLRDQNPTWSNDQIRQQLQNTAVPMADQTQSGAGRMDVAQALSISSSTPPSVSISGPTNMFEGTSDDFTANVTDGEPPYNYQWYYRHETDFNWTPTGTNSPTYNHTAGPPNGEYIRVIVTDSENQSDEDVHFFTIMGVCC